MSLPHLRVSMFLAPKRTNTFFPLDILRKVSLNDTAQNGNFNTLADKSSICSAKFESPEPPLVLDSLFADEISPVLPEYTYREEYKPEPESTEMITDQLEIYNKFKSTNDDIVDVLACPTDSSIAIDFDVDSFDFAVDLDFGTRGESAGEVSSVEMQLSPFESNHECRGTLCRIRRLLSRLHPKPLGVVTQLREFSPISLQMPLKDIEASFLWARQEDEATASIKFNNQVDMLVFNRNSTDCGEHTFRPSAFSGISSRGRRFSIRGFKNGRRLSVSLSRKVSRSISNFQAKTILKNKNNLNYETENLNTIKDDSVNYAAFLEKFEKYELEKIQNEFQIRTLRHKQLSNYYEQELRECRS